MPRMLTEIILQNGDIMKKRLPVEHNRIVINAPKKGKGNVGDFATFSRESIVQERRGMWPFKRRIPKVYIMQGADQCITFHDGATTEYDIPMLDKATIERYGQAAAIKYAGDMSMQVKLPTSFIILMAITVALNFLVLMVVSGRLKI